MNQSSQRRKPQKKQYTLIRTNKRTRKRQRSSRLQKILVIICCASIMFLIVAIAIDSTSNNSSRSELKYGKFISLTADKIYKAKIKPSYNNKQTIAQNFHNAIYLIKERGRTEPFEYWAVADMTDGSEGKVISFDVGEEAIRIVREGKVSGTLIEAPNGATYDFENLISDLWILPSLQQ